ncbi:MAG: hypothetical protein LDL44_19070, partial [Caenispirillum sp.]|nr:hypothetical protein [Caenispirillum sp.]
MRIQTPAAYAAAAPQSMVAVYAVLTLLSLLLGFVAYTAQPIVVGLGVGLLGGAMLLARPVWIIWLVFFFGLLVAGVVPIWAEGAASKAVWGISVLGFLLLLRASFHAATVPAARAQTPAFVWAALAFLLYTVLNTHFNWPTAYEALGGFKRYFQAIGLLFALAWLPIGERDVAKWRRFLIAVALLQLPWAIYERIRLVPIREGLVYAYPGLVPIDVVAGTFGANMTSGGANAEMATFLIIVLAFLLARLREKIFGLGRLLLLAPFVLAPLFLGETKVVVVLLPLMFLVLYRRELLARPHYALAGLVFGALLTTAAGYVYLEITKKPLDRLVHETLSYNVYEKGYGGYALNRTTVLTFWASRQGLNDPAGALLGHGLGTAHDSTGGEISRRYPGYGIGLTAASQLLWEQGVLGMALFLSILVFAWRAAGRVRRAPAAPPWARAD